MTEILLAGNEIRPFGIDTPFGHWQLVYTDNANLNEATFDWEIEVQAPGNVTFGNWLFPDLPRDHSANTPNFNVQNRYDTTVIDTGGRSAESIWNIFTQVHQQFAAQGGGLDYDVNQNSNSYVNTLLYVVGLNLTTIRTGINIPEAGNFPGSNTNVLLGNRSNVVINLNIVGTEEDDIIRTGIGDDTLDGGAGADRMEGGAGLDTYI